MSGQASPRRVRSRMSRQLPLAVGLVVLWLLLWDELTIVNLVTGLLVAVFVITVFYLPPVEFGGRIDLLATLRLGGRLAWDITVASLEVAGQALASWRQPRSSIITVQLHSRSDLILTWTAQATSLVPGSYVVEVDREHSVMFVHVLHAPDDRALERARRTTLDTEARIVRAVGSREDVEALERDQRGRTQP